MAEHHVDQRRRQEGVRHAVAGDQLQEAADVRRGHHHDLAAERLVPLIAEAAAQFEADRQRERLSAHFGGEDRFRQVAAQLSAWGRAKLPEPVFQALSSTAEGVLALEQMMRKEEPGLSRDSAPPARESEAELRAMMRDPRYWRSREPEFVRRVTEGFRRLVSSG
mgnify:CR=1 FL=1